MPLVAWLPDSAESKCNSQGIGPWEAFCPICTVCFCGHRSQRWPSRITMTWLLGSLEHFVVSPPPSTPIPCAVICSCPSRRNGWFILSYWRELWRGEHEGLPCRQFNQQSLACCSRASAPHQQFLASILQCLSQEGLGTPGRNLFFFFFNFIEA